MPGFDGTGPLGQGPMTGWGRGFCAPGTGRYIGFGRGWGRGLGRGWGRGFGRGWGRGPGWGFGRGRWSPGWWWRGPGWLSPTEEKAFLEDEAAFLEREIQDIRQRLAELESQGETTNQAE